LEIKKITQEMVKRVQTISKKILKDEKLLMVIGGDHSITNGVLNALDEVHGAENVTIIHFDAHLDMREAYDAQEYSHASVMHNARKKGFPMVHIGIRDHISSEEADFIRENKWESTIFFCATQPLAFYTTYAPKKGLFSPSNMIMNGLISPSQMGMILSSIKTKYVYISLDMDVLDPPLVPGTGTPLPLGMRLESLQEVLFAILQQCKTQKSILVGFDITEIAPLLRKPSGKYNSKNVLSPLIEVHASLLAYKILFWWYLEKFLKK
ncbi:MAG: arginase family protein, partial [archaeon]|nr:arginase family protein [archaeon]